MGLQSPSWAPVVLRGGTGWAEAERRRSQVPGAHPQRLAVSSPAVLGRATDKYRFQLQLAGSFCRNDFEMPVKNNKAPLKFLP